MRECGGVVGSWLALALVSVVGVLESCAAKGPTQPADPSVIDIALPPRLPREVIGRSVEGRAIECCVVGEGSITVMFIASIHGDEPAGTPLLEMLLREAARTPPPDWMRDRRLVVIPIANPDGYAHQRRNNAQRIDLNRNFPAQSFRNRRRYGDRPLSAPESQTVHAALERFEPQRIISMHQPLACIDYDGPAAQLADAMSRATTGRAHLPVRRLGAYPGSLGSFGGEDRGVPIITVELPGNASRLHTDELWQRYGDMTIAAVAFEGHLDSQ